MVATTMSQYDLLNYLKHGKNSQNEIITFYKTMLEDLRAAQALYNEKFYSQALFNLQQSVEKGWKAYAKCMFILGDVKGIGHNITDNFNPDKTRNIKYIYSNLSKMFVLVQEIPELTDFFNEIGINPIKLPDALLEHINREKDTIKSITKHDTWSAEELDNWLSSCDTISEGVGFIIELLRDYKLEDSPEISEMICMEVAPFLNKLIFGFVDCFSVSDEIKKSIIISPPSEEGTETLWNIHLIKIFITSLGCFFLLSMLNVILDSQFSKLRYPTSGKSPSEIYSENHEIVKRMPKLFELTKRATEILYENLKDNQIALGIEE